MESIEPGDVVITLGAGDSDAVGEMLLRRLHEQKERNATT
jgi:hypothetical protein